MRVIERNERERWRGEERDRGMEVREAGLMDRKKIKGSDWSVTSNSVDRTIRST